MSGKLHGPYSTDVLGSKIYGKSDMDGGVNIVLDVRGWGYLTGHGHGALGMDDHPAMEEQQEFAARVVAALNAAEGHPNPDKETQEKSKRASGAGGSHGGQ